MTSFSHLGQLTCTLAPPDEQRLRAIATAPHKHASARFERMLPETERTLQDFFDPWNRRLCRLLGRAEATFWDYG